MSKINRYLFVPLLVKFSETTTKRIKQNNNNKPWLMQTEKEQGTCWNITKIHPNENPRLLIGWKKKQSKTQDFCVFQY